MMTKTARVELAALLKNANDERLENLKRAFENGRLAHAARSEDPQAVKPYSNRHFLTLIKACGDLVGLVEQ